MVPRVSANRVADPPLENTANRVAPAGQSAAEAECKRSDGSGYRVERWEARGALWDLSSLDRVRGCGRYAITADGSVQVRSNGRAVGYAGLASCGSIWSCPVCNAKVQAVRRLEVGTALAWSLADGGAAFGAYTLRHHAGSSLDATWRGLTKCWQAVSRDKTVRTLRSSLGLRGTIRAAEVTHGVNGWHPHLHPVHLFAAPVSADAVAALHAAQFGAWSRAADRLGYAAPMLAAQDLHRVAGAAAHEELGDYFTKSSYVPTSDAVGWEMTSTQTKSRSRGDGRTPWDLLRAVHVDGDADALDLWHRWETDSKGKRALTWSRGLRHSIGLDVEASDEDIAAAEVGSAADAGFTITDWAPIRSNPRLGAQLLGVIGTGSRWADGRRFCREHGIETRGATDEAR